MDPIHCFNPEMVVFLSPLVKVISFFFSVSLGKVITLRGWGGRLPVDLAVGILCLLFGNSLYGVAFYRCILGIPLEGDFWYFWWCIGGTVEERFSLYMEWGGYCCIALIRANATSSLSVRNYILNKTWQVLT